MVVGVQGQIGLNALETRDNAGEWAHVPAKTRNRDRRQNASVAAARHDQFVALAKLDRRWLTAGITQLLAAAARTLGTERHIVLHDGRAQQVEADDVIAQLSAKTGGDRFGDLDGRKLDGALSERVPGQWRNGDAAGLSAVEQRLDLPVPVHPLSKTHPAGAFAWAEDRSHKGENAGRLDEHPGSAVRQMAAVQFRQLRFEIIVHQRGRQAGGALDDANAELAQGSPEF